MTAVRPAFVGAAGFTLVELMIALTLALVISAAASSVYLGSTQSYRTGTGLSQLQEQQRFLGLLVAPVLRQAGYVADPVLTGTDPALVFRRSNQQGAVIGYRAGKTLSYPGLASSSIKPGTDVVAVSFIGQTADAPLRTCLGAPVYSDSIAVNLLYVGLPDASGVSSLGCYSNVSKIGAGLSTGTINNQPLIPGVADVKVLYGLDLRNDGSTSGYYSAEQVDGLKVSAAADPANPWLTVDPWLAVTNIQITYTLVSSDPVERSRASATASIGADGRLISPVTMTVAIRNRLHN